MQNSLVKLPVVLQARGRSRSGHYDEIKKGLFTPPVHISARSVAWPAYEVNALNAARIAGKSEEEIRALVVKLIADRKSAQ